MSDPVMNDDRLDEAFKAFEADAQVGDARLAFKAQALKLFAELNDENTSINRLFAMQEKRMVEARQRWQEAMGEHMTWPDLGKLLEWMLERADAVEKENAALEGQLSVVRENALKVMGLYPQGSPESKAMSALFAMAAPSSRSPSALFAEVKKLKEAAREHMVQDGDDRCWLDDEKMYTKFGLDIEEWNSALPPREEMMANCGRYHDSRVKPGHVYVTVAERINQTLDKAIEIVRAQPYYPDTNIGKRQQWVKDQIVEGIEKLKKP